MTLLPQVSASEERQFQTKSISQQRERYLSTDVLQKIQVDAGYAEKVRQVEKALGSPDGLIVDIGSNTCGESEYLTTRGFPILCTDINDVALQLSQERCRKFSRKAPSYLACDAHHLPLQDESAHFVIFNESLHHMEDTMQVLHEVARVLAPGGRVFLYEPYAYNPYRRLSEIRDRFLGTIERSFGVSQLRRLFRDAGLSMVSIDRHTCAPSQWKKDAMGGTHRVLKQLYYSAAKALPSIFGNLVALAEKPGKSSAPHVVSSLESITRCPVTGSRLLKIEEKGYLSLNHDFRGLFPIRRGIPVLIRAEALLLDEIVWQALIDSNSPAAEPRNGNKPTHHLRVPVY